LRTYLSVVHFDLVDDGADVSAPEGVSLLSTFVRTVSTNAAILSSVIRTLQRPQVAQVRRWTVCRAWQIGSNVE
jgi:hypothetical protein